MLNLPSFLDFLHRYSFWRNTLR